LSRADDQYDLLLRAAAPLTVAPLGSTAAPGPRLRGVVRTGSHARLVVTAEPGQHTGVAIDFPLDDGFDAAACLDWTRSTPAQQLHTAARSSNRQDSHGNRIIAAAVAGWRPDLQPTEPDQNYFTLLSLLLFGGGALWFEDVYTVTGYLLIGAGRHRLYVHDQATSEQLGLDLPLTATGGRVTPGFAGSLPQELASVLSSGHIRVQPTRPADDYCTTAYDLTKWVDPQTT
jgi:hypothetical protein